MGSKFALLPPAATIYDQSIPVNDWGVEESNAWLIRPTAADLTPPPDVRTERETVIDIPVGTIHERPTRPVPYEESLILARSPVASEGECLACGQPIATLGELAVACVGYELTDVVHAGDCEVPYGVASFAEWIRGR